jgi:hypothetical protein
MKPEAPRRQNLDNLQLYFKAADKDMHATVTTGTSGYTANATLLSDLTQALNNLSNNSNSRLTAVAYADDHSALLVYHAELIARKYALAQAHKRTPSDNNTNPTNRANTAATV